MIAGRSISALLLATALLVPVAGSAAEKSLPKPTARPATMAKVPVGKSIPAAAFDPKPTGVPVTVPLPGLSGPTLTPAPADDPDGDPVYAAFQRGLYVHAFLLAADRAGAGDTAAMTMLGTLFETGLGVKPDEPKAAEWYRLAAARGDREAAAALGQMTIDGRGTAKDPKHAFELFVAAAEKDQPVALYDAAVMLLDGSVTTADPVRAGRYLARAAELGNIDAQYAYASFLSDPGNPEKDPEKAAKWMKEAALAGFEAAEVEWGLMLANGRGVPQNLADAFVWLHRSALRGNAIGRNRVARMYALGLGVAPDPVEAWKWHLLARAQGLSDLWLETRLAGMSDAERRTAAAAAAAVDSLAEGTATPSATGHGAPAVPGDVPAPAGGAPPPG